MECRNKNIKASKTQIIFFIFVMGSVIGTFYEEILNFFKFGTWVSRSGLIYGPFNPIYGIGFAMFVLLLGENKNNRKDYITYLYCCLIGGVTEYLLSFFTEKIFNVFSWNYKGYFLNINGRTTITFMIVWGMGGYVFIKYIYPNIVKLLDNVDVKLRNYGLIFLAILMIFNMLMSGIAVIRQDRRDKGIPAYTSIDRFCDKYYTDEFLYKIYPNMVKIK